MATQTKGSSSELPQQRSTTSVESSPLQTQSLSEPTNIQARGGQPGGDLDDWLRAEQELQGARPQ